MTSIEHDAGTAAAITMAAAAMVRERAIDVTGSPVKIKFEDLVSELRARGARVQRNWKLLSAIYERHGPDIQKRWANRDRNKRKALILAAWPGMAEKHRPDYHAYLSRITEERQGQSTTKYPVSEGPLRDVFTMPYMNLEDLCKDEPLALLLDQRARAGPWRFANDELDFSTLGEYTGCIQWGLAFDNHDVWSISFRWIDDEYAQLVPRPGATEGLLPPQPIPRRFSWLKDPGAGLLTLVIQDRIYDFLVKTAQMILGHMSPGDLLGPAHKVQPALEMPVKQRSLGTLIHCNMQVSYTERYPWIEIEHLSMMVSAYRRYAEDVLLALRDDPGYLSHSLQERWDHTPEHEKQLLSKLSSEMQQGESAESVIRSALHKVEQWRCLSDQMEGLCSECHSVLNSKRFPTVLPFQLERSIAQALQELDKCISQRLVPIDSLMRSSPRIRPFEHFQPPQSEGQKVKSAIRAKEWEKAPSNVKLILERISSALGILTRDSKKSTIDKLCLLAILVEKYDRFYENDGTRKILSPLLLRRVSELTFQWELAHQISSFQDRFYSAIPPCMIPQSTHWFEGSKIICRILLPFMSRDSKTLAASMRKVDYPVDKEHSKENVEKMRRVESELASIWKTISDAPKNENVISTYSRGLFKEREAVRTPAWVEASSLETPPAQSLLMGLEAEITQPSEDKNSGCVKIGNNSAETGQAEEGPSDCFSPSIKSVINPVERGKSLEKPILPKIVVHEETFEILQIIFSTPLRLPQPKNSILWDEFVSAMRDVGFLCFRIAGSAWYFWPNSQVPPSAWIISPIIFHEPYPYHDSKLSHIMVRDIKRRLERAYQWDSDTFEQKQKKDSASSEYSHTLCGSDVNSSNGLAEE